MVYYTLIDRSFLFIELDNLWRMEVKNEIFTLNIYLSRQKITSPYAKPISNYSTSFDCPNRPVMKLIYFLA